MWGRKVAWEQRVAQNPGSLSAVWATYQTTDAAAVMA